VNKISKGAGTEIGHAIYSSNLDVSASLIVKKKLFGKSCDDAHNGSNFLLLLSSPTKPC
jgi:hypothetical protein